MLWETCVSSIYTNELIAESSSAKHSETLHAYGYNQPLHAVVLHCVCKCLIAETFAKAASRLLAGNSSAAEGTIRPC
jgi:hypothetical protein